MSQSKDDAELPTGIALASQNAIESLAELLQFTK